MAEDDSVPGKLEAAYRDAVRTDAQDDDARQRRRVAVLGAVAALAPEAPVALAPAAANQPFWRAAPRRWPAAAAVAASMGMVAVLVHLQGPVESGRGEPPQLPSAPSAPAEATESAGRLNSPAAAPEASNAAPAATLVAAPVAAPAATPHAIARARVAKSMPPAAPPERAAGPIAEPPAIEAPAAAQGSVAEAAQDNAAATSTAAAPVRAEASPPEQSVATRREAAPPRAPAPALSAAPRPGGTDLLRQSLREGQPVDSVDADGRSALHHAVLLGDLALVRELVARGASPLLRDREGRSPQSLAEAAGNPAVLQALKAASPAQN